MRENRVGKRVREHRVGKREERVGERVGEREWTGPVRASESEGVSEDRVMHILSVAALSSSVTVTMQYPTPVTVTMQYPTPVTVTMQYPTL